MMKTRLGDTSIFPSCQALWQLNLSDGTAPPQEISGLEAGLIQSLSQALLSVLSAWVEVGGIAPSLCLKAPPLQPIST